MPTLNRTQAIPLANYPTGVRTLPEVSIEDTATALYFELARCTSTTPTIWPNAATEVDFKLEVSYDAGASWGFLSGFHAKGGIHVKRDGTEASTSTQLTDIAPGTNRKLRGTVEVINGPLRTQGFIETRN